MRKMGSGNQYVVILEDCDIENKDIQVSYYDILNGWIYPNHSRLSYQSNYIFLSVEKPEHKITLPKVIKYYDRKIHRVGSIYCHCYNENEHNQMLTEIIQITPIIKKAKNNIYSSFMIWKTIKVPIFLKTVLM